MPVRGSAALLSERPFVADMLALLKTGLYGPTFPSPLAGIFTAVYGPAHFFAIFAAEKMMHKRFHKIYAALLLALLFAAHGGQQAHIYREDPLHFAAFSGDLVPDNGATEGVSERCIVDDYYFFPFLEEVQPAHTFYAAVLAVVRAEATHCKCCEALRIAPLRAPPMA